MSHPFPLQIETQRLRLRKPVPGDADTIFRRYAQDTQVCRFMIWQPHESEAVTHAFIESCLGAWDRGDCLPYVVAEPSDDSAIGMIDARIAVNSVEIGYVLAQAHWGRGYMPEAIAALAGIALASPGFFRVHAACDTENHASQRALEKAGFAREGRLARYAVHPNISLEPRDCYMYAKWR